MKNKQPLADLADYSDVPAKFGFDKIHELTTRSNIGTTKYHLTLQNVECDKVRGNSTALFNDTPYSGIHIILAINIATWFLCVIFFALIRRYAFDDEKKLLQNERTKSQDNDENSINNSVSGISLDLCSNSSTNDLIKQVHEDKHIFSFITRTIHLNDTQFQQKCGASAVQYLRFQRFVWYLLFLITLLSCICILPANFYGTISDKTSFKRTTIGNLTANSALIWIHTVAAVVFVFIGRQLMKTFRKSTLDAASTTGHTDTGDVLLFSDIPISEGTDTNTYRMN